MYGIGKITLIYCWDMSGHVGRNAFNVYNFTALLPSLKLLFILKFEVTTAVKM
jgi:hypothetical protein